MTATTYENRWGRRQSRGFRPFLLIPKVIAVGLYLGGLAAALVFWLTSGLSSLPAADPRRLYILTQTGKLFEYLIVPALLCILALSVGLFLQHPRQFIRMRWLLVKLASLLILIPSAHLYLSSRLHLLRAAYESGTANEAAAGQFTMGLLLTLAGSIWIIVLGRLKPRLGQNWARAYAASQPGGKKR